jgi:hypothetical protein
MQRTALLSICKRIGTLPNFIEPYVSLTLVLTHRRDFACQTSIINPSETLRPSSTLRFECSRDRVFDPCTVFIGMLQKTVKNDTLRALFEHYGDVFIDGSYRTRLRMFDM